MATFNLGDCTGAANAFGGGAVAYGSDNGNPWVTGPAKIVTEHVDLAHQYASQAFDNTWCFLTGLSTFAPTLNDISSSVTFGDISLPDPVFNKPTAPTTPTLTLTIPTFPDEFVPGDIRDFDDTVVGTVPTLATTAPTVNLPAKPGDLEATPPGDAPTIADSFDVPVAPSSALPSVPTLKELEIPDALDIDIPVFDQALPTLPATLTPPGLIFNFEEQAYTSTLMDALTAELLDRIQNGGTGLNTDVEQAIWDRARNREDQNAIRSENQINVEQAARGFNRPPGSHLAALDQLSQETQNKNADLSREVAIRQAELEQQNIQFALQTSLALEQSWLTYHNQIQQRAFESERFIQDAAIALYEADIKKFQLQLDVYKTFAEAFESRVRAELTKVEIFRSQIDAQRLISDINSQAIDLYRARIDGIKTSVDIYRTEIEALKAKIEAEGLRIQNFKSQVDVFTAQVAAKKSEYDNYAAAVDGELAKVNVFDSQVKAFISRVQAYSAVVDTETKKIDSDIAVEGLRLQQYLARIQSVVENVRAQAAVTNAQVDVFRGQADAYRSEVQAETARLEGETRVYDLLIEQKKQEAQVELENARINIENANNSITLLLQALQSGAQVGSSLSAASLSAMNIGASISGSSTDQHIYNEK